MKSYSISILALGATILLRMSKQKFRSITIFRGRSTRLLSIRRTTLVFPYTTILTQIGFLVVFSSAILLIVERTRVLA